MEKSVGFVDRVFRFLIGVFLITWAIAGGPVWSWLGIALLATSAWSRCPVYSVLGISTRSKPKTP